MSGAAEAASATTKPDSPGICPVCFATNVVLRDARCPSCGNSLLRAKCAACRQERYVSSFVPDPLEPQSKSAIGIWPGNLTPEEHARLAERSLELVPASLCGGCSREVFRDHALARWRDFVVATAVTVVFALLGNGWAYVFGLSAIVSLLLAVRASRILVRPSANREVAAELVRRWVRRRQLDPV